MVVVSVMLLVFNGVWTAALAFANNDTAAQATGYGARVAAEIGSTCRQIGGTTTCSSTCPSGNVDDPCLADQEVLQAMEPALKQLTDSVPQQIDIYQPTSCQPNAEGVLPASCPAGTYNGSNTYGPPTTGDLIDPYKWCSATNSWDLVAGSGTATGSGNCITGLVGNYLLDLRTQNIDDEQAIGVWMSFQFTAPTPGMSFFSQTFTAYTAITLPPEGS
jgi:hypothetical protein